MPAHYCEGSIQIAFVFSVPGAAEQEADKPVAGETGRNLEVALSHLHQFLPELFKSKHRYDYRITNAFTKPIARSLGHSASEAPNKKIKEPENLTRVARELKNCDIVILSGKKSQLLRKHLEAPGRTIIPVAHVGNAGLNSIELPSAVAAETSSERRKQRIERWANQVKTGIDTNTS